MCQRYSFYSLNGGSTLGVFDSSLLIGWVLIIGLGQAALRESKREGLFLQELSRKDQYKEMVVNKWGEKTTVLVTEAILAQPK